MPANIPFSSLADWAARVLAESGVPIDDARRAAAALVDANLCGIDTHGVSRLPGYVDYLRRGLVNPEPKISFQDRSGALVMDADRALGQLAGAVAVERACAEARTQAVVAMSIRMIGHLGALGYFTAQAAEQGMIGVLMQNGPPMMGLPGATAAGVGNNPLAFSAPVSGGRPLTFDTAMSEVAFGKIIEAAREGLPIPPGWSLDKHGQPTTDSRAALQGFLLPAGGHKGVGFAMLVELLAGSLTGVAAADAVPPGGSMPAYFGAFLLVINPDLLIGRRAFEAHLGAWLDHYRKSSATARYPGEGAGATRARRMAEGVTLPDGAVAALEELGRKVGVPFSFRG